MSNRISINDLISEERLLEMLFDGVKDSAFFDQDLYEKIVSYTESYLSKNASETTAPTKIYQDFIQRYSKDMKAFLKTGKYPMELSEDVAQPSRDEYDVILLFSCLFTEHRFRIMQLIREKTVAAKTGLVIGCGPGLEIELIKGKIEALHAYDLSIDARLPKVHPQVQFFEELYHGGKDQIQPDTIYLIELLEHLAAPMDLLQVCHQALSAEGLVYLTTATNIPQFDHLYNFEVSHQKFESQVQEMGFSIEFSEAIGHRSVTLDINASNRFYVLRK